MRRLVLLAFAIGAAFLALAGPAALHAAPAADTVAIARIAIPQAMLANARREILLVDVRPQWQRALGHIRGDVGVPVNRIATVGAQLPRDQRLVFYCSCPAEELALEAARALLKIRKDASVAVLVGGYDGWHGVGGPTVIDVPWEKVFNVDAPPAGWGKNPIDSLRCRYAVDTAVASQGRASGRIVCVPDTSARGFAGYAQRLDDPRLRGRSVTLSAMVRTQEVARGAYLWIGAENPQGRIQTLTPPGTNIMVGSSGWRMSVVSARIPSDAAKVLVGISLMTSGRVWLDDVRLMVPDEGGLPGFRVALKNAGFEE